MDANILGSSKHTVAHFPSILLFFFLGRCNMFPREYKDKSDSNVNSRRINMEMFIILLNLSGFRDALRAG